MSPITGQPPSPAAKAAKAGYPGVGGHGHHHIDHRGLIESINPATEPLFGYGAQELIGQNVKMLVPEPGGRAHSDACARETIMVAEDDGRVRRLAVERLNLIGYRVLEASDGPMALEILRGSDAVDLVFTDPIMPGGLSGREVARRPRDEAGPEGLADLGICRGARAR